MTILSINISSTAYRPNYLCIIERFLPAHNQWVSIVQSFPAYDETADSASAADTLKVCGIKYAHKLPILSNNFIKKVCSLTPTCCKCLFDTYIVTPLNI